MQSLACTHVPSASMQAHTDTHRRKYRHTGTNTRRQAVALARKAPAWAYRKAADSKQ